jgi:ribose transport system permease protein
MPDPTREVTTAMPDPVKPRRRFPSALSPRDAGALYVLFLLIVIFSIWLPDTFPNWITVTSTLNDTAIAGLLALGLLIPLAAGEFDLSIGYVLGVASVLFGWLLAETGLGVVPAALVVLATCALIGIGNAILVTILGINSFIATLASGSLLMALIQTISGGNVIVEGVAASHWLATTEVADITLPVMAMLLFTVVLWLVLSHSATGRKLYATGLGGEAAHLSGVPIRRLKFCSFIVSGVAGGVAGILLTAQVGAASPEAGPAYLIPAFAAAFLGATQFKPGLFNAWGTLLAVVLIGVLNTGLALAAAPTWVPYLSTGSVLIIALAIGQVRQKQTGRVARRKRRGRRRESPTQGSGSDRERQSAPVGAS